ncbi:hypothetical protein [Inquilinus limosus]|nr:hypothetical protein [Inquilinus limosus]
MAVDPQIAFIRQRIAAVSGDARPGAAGMMEVAIGHPAAILRRQAAA